MSSFITEDEAIKRNICVCECHIQGLGVMHFMPCCNNTYEIYINEDNSVDIDKYNALNKEKNDEISSQKRGEV